MSDGDDTLPREELRDSALRGVRWVAIARVVAEAVSFASMVVLAHLIDPAEFGRATSPPRRASRPGPRCSFS